MTLYGTFLPSSGETFAAPSERDAQLLADKLMAHFAAIKKERGDAYPTVIPEVVIWPASDAKGHAKQLAEDWPDHAKFIGPVDMEPERDTKTIDMFAPEG